MRKIIDISKWQGKIAWTKLRESDVAGVIIRFGSGCSTDTYAIENYTNAKKIGLDVGAYWYINDFDAKSVFVDQFKKFKESIKGLQFELPIFIDAEKERLFNETFNNLTMLSQMKNMEKENYYVGIYTNNYLYNKYCKDTQFNKFYSWIARYTAASNVVNETNYMKCKKPDYEMVDLWQYTDSVNTNYCAINLVDYSIEYANVTPLIKKLGLNGFANPSPLDPMEQEPVPKDAEIEKLIAEIENKLEMLKRCLNETKK